MPRRTRRARGARRGMTIGLLVVASIAIITLDYRGQAHGVISSAKRDAHDAFSPVQRGVDALARPVGSFLAGDAEFVAHPAASRPGAMGGIDTHRHRAGHRPQHVGLCRHRAARQGNQERRGRRHARGRGGGTGGPGHRCVVLGMHGTPRHRCRLVGRGPLRHGWEPRPRSGLGSGQKSGREPHRPGHGAAQGGSAHHERSAERPVPAGHPRRHRHIVLVDTLGHPGDGLGPTSRRSGRLAVCRRAPVAVLAVTRAVATPRPGGALTTADVARSTIVIAVALVVQHTLLDSVRVGGAHPDLMLLLPVAAGYAAGPDRGAVFGFISGLVADLFLPTPYGLSALVGCLLGYGTGLATRGLVRSSWWLPPVVAAAATAAGMGAYAILGAVLGDPGMLKIYLAPALVIATPAAALRALPAPRFVAGPVPAPGPSHGSAAGGGMR